MKLCKDCQWRIIMKLCKDCQEYKEPQCRRIYHDLVAAGKLDQMSAQRAREVEGYCGEKGKYYKKKEKKLQLNVIESNLFVLYGDIWLGWIGLGSKELYINTTEEGIETYEKWQADGMPVSKTKITWNEGVYKIGADWVLRRADKEPCGIYDFEHCEAICGCNDPNVLRWSHNKKPIIF